MVNEDLFDSKDILLNGFITPVPDPLEHGEGLFDGEDTHPDGSHMVPYNATTTKVTVVTHPQLDGMSCYYLTFVIHITSLICR